MSATPLAKIPATIITGFLGAGKTTLIRHVLETAKGRRLALVVNEFGDGRRRRRTCCAAAAASRAAGPTSSAPTR